MEPFIAISTTPIPTIIVVAGIFFLVLSVASIKGIKPSPQRQRNSAIIGIVLLVIGIALYVTTVILTTPFTSTATPTLTITPQADTPTPMVNFPSGANSTLTFTPPPPGAMSGFENQCINSEIWTPYTVNAIYPKENNCWNLSSKGMSAYDNNLLFSVITSEQSGSIYMPLPDSGTISFKIQVNKFKIGGSNGNLAFGVGNTNEWLQSGKFLFLRVNESDAPIYYVFGNSVVNTGETTINAYKLGTSQKITFEIKGLLLNIYIDNNLVIPSVTLSPSQKEVFWIGYRLPSNSELVASVSDFTLEK